LLDVERSRNIARDGQINKFSQRDALGAEIQVFDEAWNVLETIENEARDRLCELSQANRSIESESGLEDRPPGTTSGRPALFVVATVHAAAERHSQCSHIRDGPVYKNHNK